MGYSERDAMVRVDFFKPSGKWYATEAVDMGDFYAYSDGPIEAVRLAVLRHCKGRLQGMTIICLKPYHKNAFPVMIPSKE